MTVSAPKYPVLTEQRLRSAIDEARTSCHEADGALFAAVKQLLEVPFEVLSEGLLCHQGIAVLDDEVLAQAQVALISGAPEGALVLHQGASYLLFDDPWSDNAIRSLLAGMNHGARLALARPGQLARLDLAPGSFDRYGGAAASGGLTLNGGHSNPVVAFVSSAIDKGYVDGASDIHFECDRSGVVVKFRLDGVMVAGERLPDPQRAEEVISRIKVLAQLDITERRRPQDGRIHWHSSSTPHSIDLRVSIMPSIFGEDAVLRLLDKAQLRHNHHQMTLDLLGFEGRRLRDIRDLARRPHGMLLVTGPTGSGKTTSVYAALTEVNDGLEKIITIEDPVEYELPGVLQIPVNEQKGLTFATGLRSILRHDPDKILVGEIRDAETAQIAVQSSLTGHLVFTTVHANSLFDVLGRFQHFDIDAFALASALNGVVVQRLLRRTCPHCLAWRPILEEERTRIADLELPTIEMLPAPSGCTHCRSTGYRGRFVVAEVHVINDRARELMVTRTNVTELKRMLYQDSAQRLIVQAMQMVEAGKTTLEEVRRVVGLA